MRPVNGKTALIVVDVQNDFCSPEGKCAQMGDDLSGMEEAIRNLESVVENARGRGMEVIFIQYFGDKKYQPSNQIERDRANGRVPKALENTWGSEFYRVVPLDSEKVVKKYACFDAFLNPELERYLKGQNITNLVFTGVFLDMCVDSTARTAFQKGFFVSVIEDCTVSLHMKKSKSLELMRKFYGAITETSTAFKSTRN